MSVTRFRLARASRLERQVIENMRLLASRSGESGWFSSACNLALADLVHLAVGQGYEIWAPGSDHIGPDELTLVGWLALCQREYLKTSAVIDRELQVPLHEAARLIKPTHFLPYQAVLKGGFASGHSLALPPSRSGASQQRRKAPREYSKWPQCDTLRGRAVAFVREHGRVSTKQLSALGLTTQYVSNLCLKGALIRVRHGYYEVPKIGYPQAIGSSSPPSHTQFQENPPDSVNAWNPRKRMPDFIPQPS